ncbi:peptidoglycan-binding protein [Candidatus Pseudoscillospira sp. SGI.172]|uniref:peptidoglycan-binding protein n=1 Tax=Candidatus Pseudoscillospira sp. SGI.172 TaxID=3420582 RepID=UPI002A7BB5C2|nr:peptidoglycan-binding protein [Pseudoflavonifractor sp.]MDY3018612.1 peptidoglycan-binding protein [Oscillospiraceae bacterium]
MALTTTPYVPEYITVHIGTAGSGGQNVTVSFPDYIKNVASSEIYPTWEPSALRANILAQISFALNRVYTEFYRSRGYPFQITSTTAQDQKFIPGRNIFENISQLVDEIFTDYIRRQGNVEPLSAKFCNGTTTTCDGLSQWGSQDLALEGYDSMEILRNYYGNNIELVTDAPIRGIQQSYPGSPLRKGSSGSNVTFLQTAMNRISQDYPAIPKIWPVDGVFGDQTEAAVRKFQSIFNLTSDGIVGEATWYKMIYLYVGIKKLSELVSEGQDYFGISFQYPDALKRGDTGEKVRILQYMLSMLAQFNDTIPPVTVDGVFGAETEEAVRAFQHKKHLPETGVVDAETWDYLYREFQGVSETVLDNPVLFPQEKAAGADASSAYGTTTRLTQYPGYSLTLGSRDTEGGF